MSLELTSNDSQNNFKMREVNGQRFYEFEDFTLDAVHLLLFRSGEQLSVTPKVVETLRALVEHRGEVLSKDELMNIVWPDSIVEESNISQNLYLLRKVLGTTKGGQPVIETLRRRGYRFNAEVTVADGARPQDNGNSKEKGQDPEIITAPSSGLVRAFSVQRQGNVLALADWKKDERVHQPIPASGSAISTPDQRSRSRRWVMYLAATMIAAILLSFSVSGWRFFSSANNESKAELTITKLTAGEYIDAATISRDGNYFTYITNDGEKNHLWLQQTGQASRVEITEPFDGVVYGTTFTPDSKFIYLVVRDRSSDINSLYRVPTLGGIRTKLVTDISAHVSFSPDGGKMVFMRGDPAANESTIIVASSDGTSEKPLLANRGENGIAMYGGGEWSPDGKIIAWGAAEVKALNRGACTIMGIDAATAEVKPLSNEKWDNCFRMAWTRDSQGLVFVGTRIDDGLSTRRDQIYFLDLRRGGSRRLTTDGSRYQVASLGITDTEQIFAVPYNRLSQLWSMSADGDARTAVQITNGQADGRSGISPIADGRIAYLTRNGESLSLWTINGDGSEGRQLTANMVAIEELRAPADGSFFVHAGKIDGRGHLFRIDANGERRQQLTFGDSEEVDSTVSTDGNWIIYGSRIVDGDVDTTALWRIPAVGGEPVRLSNIACSTPHFSPDGNLFSCVTPDWKQLKILSAESGELIRSLNVVDNSILNVGARWTPDGRSLAYIVNRKGSSNIYIQPIDGSEPSRLTDFTSGEIYNFAYAADGSRLILARGYPVLNAVLIENFR